MAPVYADKPFALVSSPNFLKGKDEKHDIFDECASNMAAVHNTVIRGLNAIYLQAPHIKPADVKSFSTFISHWYLVIHHHHNGEETYAFPRIEEMAGEKGIMDVNVAQHHAFLDGLEEFGKYAADCAAGKEEYDGGKIVRMIDGFGAALAEHLADEIPSLENLRRFGNKMSSLKDVLQQDADNNRAKTSIHTGVVVFFTMHDPQYEDGLWANWPPMPAIVTFICKSIILPWNADVAKFGPCGKNGGLRPLYATAGGD
ncbi:uncharacterized protein DNG_04228 [Cephalotrichum gorgonifer]|uniref:Hemerythrin-like domain-containing protein n=1 Tax=Cephalotrichum gorgonifer TaxID=2041049 RepID=A0AAE8MVN6_9PEZI|nr:uncharacterized protein DNG_04228 [Cephalotrichum gorgonifer]